MKISQISLLLISITLVSCSSDDAVIDLKEDLQARSFELKTPQGWVLIEEQGINTYIGHITNGEERIHFDQSYFAFGTLGNIEESENTLFFNRMGINGISAIIKKKRFK